MKPRLNEKSRRQRLCLPVLDPRENLGAGSGNGTGARPDLCSTINLVDLEKVT